MTRLPADPLSSYLSRYGIEMPARRVALQTPRIRREEAALAPEEEKSLLRMLGEKSLGGVAAVGNLIGLPSSMLLDTASSLVQGEFVNPFDQLLTPFSSENRTGGRDLLTQMGMRPNVESGITGWINDPGEGLRDIAGFGLEVALDPFVFATGPTKAAIKALGVNPLTRAVGRGITSTRPGAAAVDLGEQLGRGATALFHRPVRGALTRQGQALGRAATAAEREAAVTASERWAPHVEAFGQYLNTLPDTPSRISAHDVLREVLEDSTGKKALPAGMQGLQSVVDQARQLRNEMIPRERAAGVVSKDVDDLYAEYVTRRAVRFPGDKSAPDFMSRMLSGAHSSQKHRKDFLRDVQGGTRVLNRLSVDPRLSGVAHKLPPGRINKQFWDQQEQVLQDAFDVAGAPNLLFENKRELTRWLANLDPRHVAEGVPIFPHNPIEELALRESLGERAIALGSVIRESLGGKIQSLDDAGVGTRKLGDVLDAANLNVKDTLGLLGAKATDRVPADLADDIGRVIKTFRAPEEVGKLLATTDAFTRLWKAGMTSFPAFHVRNLTSGTIANVLSGAFSPSGFANVWRLIHGKPMSGLQDLGPEFAGLSDDAATRLFAQQAFADQVAPRGQGIGLEDVGVGSSLERSMAADIPGLQPFSVRGSLKSAVPRTLQEANPLAISGVGAQADVFAPVRSSREFGHATESLNRIVPYLVLRKKAAKAGQVGREARREAAARARAIQVDYENLTDFERNVMRRLIPFYTFTRGQSEFLARELMARPGGAFAQAIRAQRLGASPDQPLPEHISQTGPIPYETLPDGTQRFLTGLGLMHEDPLSFAGGGIGGVGLEAASRLHPLPKAAIEAITGESFFQRGPLGGRELVDMDPAIGRLLTNVGLREELPSGKAAPVGGPMLEHFMANMPTSRLVTTLRTITDPRKYEGGVAFPGEAAALNALTGLRVSDLSPAAADRALRDQLGAHAREELGAGLFQTAYISQDLIDQTRRTNPEVAQRMESVRAMQNLVNRRARQRAKAKELEERRAAWTQTAP